MAMLDHNDDGNAAMLGRDDDTATLDHKDDGHVAMMGTQLCQAAMMKAVTLRCRPRSKEHARPRKE